MNSPTNKANRSLRPLALSILIQTLSLAISLVLVYVTTSFFLPGFDLVADFTQTGINETGLALLVLVALVLSGVILLYGLHKSGLVETNGVDSSRSTNRTKRSLRFKNRGVIVRAHNLDTSDRARSLRLLKLTRNTERLKFVEEELVRKIGRDIRIDRETNELLCEIQICVNRLLIQVAEMRQVAYGTRDADSTLQDQM